ASASCAKRSPTPTEYLLSCILSLIIFHSRTLYRAGQWWRGRYRRVPRRGIANGRSGPVPVSRFGPEELYRTHDPQMDSPPAGRNRGRASVLGDGSSTDDRR